MIDPKLAADYARLDRLREAIGRLQHEFEEAGLTPPAIVLGHPSDEHKFLAMIRATHLLLWPDTTCRPGEFRFAGTRFLSPLRSVP
jgi:hypothetical protein